MASYWSNFAKTSDPNNDPGGQPPALTWPVLGSSSQYLDLDLTSSVVTDPYQAACDWWEANVPYRSGGESFSMSRMLSHVEEAVEEQVQKKQQP